MKVVVVVDVQLLLSPARPPRGIVHGAELIPVRRWPPFSMLFCLTQPSIALGELISPWLLQHVATA